MWANLHTNKKQHDINNNKIHTHQHITQRHC